MKIKILLTLLIIITLGYFMFLNIKRKTESNQVFDINDNKIEDIKISNQNVYSNDKYSFKINYPNNVGYKLFNNGETVAFSLNNTKEQRAKAFSFVLNNYITEEFSTSVKDWWEKYGPQNERQAPYPDEEKEIKIGNNIDAYYTSYESSRTSFGYEYFTPVFLYIIHDGRVFEISGVKLPSNAKELGFSDEEINEAKSYEMIFDQMLQSFSFTK